MFRVTFGEIVAVAEGEEDLIDYLNTELEDAEFEKDITKYAITEVTNEQQLPEEWKDVIPWGVVESQATTEEWIKLVDVFNQLDDKGEQILTELLRYGTTG